MPLQVVLLSLICPRGDALKRSDVTHSYTRLTFEKVLPHAPWTDVGQT